VPVAVGNLFETSDKEGKQVVASLSRQAPDVTVVTPTLNGADYLQQCIDSVAAQASSGVRVEHLIVDDGSIDGTLEIAHSNGCRVMDGRRSGLYDAMNLGTESARGRIVSVLGSDDLLMPGSLSVVLRALSSPETSWLVGGLKWIDKDGASLGYIGPPPRWMTTAMYASLGWSCIHHQSTFLTRQFFDDVGGYDSGYRAAGDYEFLARALQKHRFLRVHALLACFRRHGNNLSMSKSITDENRAIAYNFGPESPALRRFYRETLRVWLNMRHPRWFLAKRLTTVAAKRVDPQA
jgi:glycosyltransferase involved in cell wall biosynthesis